jgi:hypothetical protein
MSYRLCAQVSSADLDQYFSPPETADSPNLTAIWRIRKCRLLIHRIPSGSVLKRRTYMKKKIIIAYALLLGATCAQAELMTWNFSGQVFWMTNSLESVYTVGQTITATIEYDLAAAVQIADHFGQAEYTNVVKSIWVNNGVETIGGTVTGDHSSGLVLSYDQSDDGISIGIWSESALLSGSDIGGLSLHGITYSMYTSNRDIYADGSLPASISLDDFDGAYMGLNYSPPESSWDNQLVYVMQPVPEPATVMLLFVGGGVGFAIHRVRRTAQRR